MWIPRPPARSLTRDRPPSTSRDPAGRCWAPRAPRPQCRRSAGPAPARSTRPPPRGRGPERFHSGGPRRAQVSFRPRDPRPQDPGPRTPTPPRRLCCRVPAPLPPPPGPAGALAGLGPWAGALGAGADSGRGRERSWGRSASIPSPLPGPGPFPATPGVPLCACPPSGRPPRPPVW